MVTYFTQVSQIGSCASERTLLIKCLIQEWCLPMIDIAACSTRGTSTLHEASEEHTGLLPNFQFFICCHEYIRENKFHNLALFPSLEANCHTKISFLLCPRYIYDFWFGLGICQNFFVWQKNSTVISFENISLGPSAVIWYWNINWYLI